MKNVLSLQRLALSSGTQGGAFYSYSWASTGGCMDPPQPPMPMTMSWATNGCMD
jgi:hypothetical protein